MYTVELTHMAVKSYHCNAKVTSSCYTVNQRILELLEDFSK